ncbi:MAG: NAD(P)/FAD-dependent oxidoreductase [Leptospiraceae bacterium]|nr:NAD(P)/FAD-dependent oxidoreductase [Leptospiraceae bacterium]
MKTARKKKTSANKKFEKTPTRGKSTSEKTVAGGAKSGGTTFHGGSRRSASPANRNEGPGRSNGKTRKEVVEATVDVLIIGAGISGIGAAYHLQDKLPNKSFIILEGREDLGGTWDLFKYPGIRSDSDLFTFGYDFRPWESSKGIADGASIKSYIRDTAREYGIDRQIIYNHRVISTDWDSREKLWNVKARRKGQTKPALFKARWIFSGTGYYRYDEGYTPDFKGRSRFKGSIIHPQNWPEDLNYEDKRVIIIGSGATAVTLLPAMSRAAAHVTMLQRTPTYVMPLPESEMLSRILKPVLGKKLAFKVTRKKNILRQRWFYLFCQRFPERARKLIRKENAKHLPPDFPVDEHFNPPYNPWDQRLCAVPDADLFKVIRDGKGSVVTDSIKTFTAKGVMLESGKELEADIIITATGLNLLPFGGIKISVDGNRVHLPDHVAFKGMMLSGIPNLAFAVGYTTSSWTLKVGLLCEHFCRLLKHMEEHNFHVCTPVADPEMETRPLLDFEAGYVQRSMDQLPRRGTRFPWLMSWDYSEDVKLLRKGPVEDRNLDFRG